jgi:CubicO group peptidase (beta-lactamase class C family)
MIRSKGKLSLEEPISKYLPEFRDMRVGVESFDPATGAQGFYTVPAKRQITVQDLLRHTSGLTYGTAPKTQVQKLYAQAGIFSQKWTLDSFCKELAKLPLQYEPGTVWEYGHSSDVLGRVVEVVSGQPLDKFLSERIFCRSRWPTPARKYRRQAEPHRAAAGGPATGKVAELDLAQPATLSRRHGLASTPATICAAQMLANGGSSGARASLAGGRSHSWRLITCSALASSAARTGCLAGGMGSARLRGTARPGRIDLAGTKDSFGMATGTAF